MKIIPFSILISLVFIVAACNTSKKITRKNAINLPSITVVANNNPIDIERTTKPIIWDIEHTRVALSFNLQDKFANGEAWINLHPYFYSTDSLMLDTKEMKIDTVFLIGAKGKVVNYSSNDQQLFIKFDQYFNKQDTLQLYIKYSTKPFQDSNAVSAANIDNRGLYFINTNHEIKNKSLEIWTQGETEYNSFWLPTIDQPNERFTTQVELIVPDSLKTLSNGELKGREIAGVNLRKDIWVMDKPIQTYAIMFLVGDYAIVEDNPFYNIKLNYYVEPKYAPLAKEIFKHTGDMMDYFSQITGVPYPWNKYSQAIVRNFHSGGMENTTATIMGDFMYQNRRELADNNTDEDVVAHELFHQWFGDYVTAESWSNLTLNESFANYSEKIWRLHEYGKIAADELAFEDLNNYLSLPTIKNEPLVRLHYTDREALFDRVTYEKGGAILHYLHGLIGDEAFFKAINYYLTQHALQSAEVSDWRSVVEKITGQDWNWFFDQWYHRGGHPIIHINYDYNDGAKMLKVNVVQYPTDSGLSYVLPLKAALIYGNEKEIVNWTINAKYQTFSFPYKNGVRPTFVPDQLHWLPGVIEEHKNLENWLVQFTQSDDYINKRRALSTGFLAQKDELTQTLFHAGLKDSIVGIRTYTLSLLQKIVDQNNWHKNFTNEVEWLSINDGNHKVRAAAFEVLGQWKIANYENEMIQAVVDSSYMIAGAAFEAIGQIDSTKAYELAQKILQSNPKAELETAAWNIIARDAQPADFDFFKQKANEVYDVQELSLSGHLYTYCVHTKDLDAFEQSLKIFVQLAIKEKNRNYRFTIGAMIFGLQHSISSQISATNDKVQKAELTKRLSLIEQNKKELLINESDPVLLKKYDAL